MITIEPPRKVLITGPSLKLRGGVAHFIGLLFTTIDPAQVDYIHVVVGKQSQASVMWKRPLEYLIELGHFILALLRKRPDLVHLNPSLTYQSLPLTAILLMVARFSKQRVVIMFHGWNEAIVEKMVLGNLIGRLLRKLVWGADRYLVLSQHFKDQLVQAGFSSKKVTVIPMMIEADAFFLGVDPPDQKSSELLHVLFLSRLERAKGIWDLMETIEWWQQNHNESPFHVTIAGDGSQKHALENFVNEKGWRSFVKFTGYILGQDKVNLFKKAQVFVFPSYHHEGFPSVILEALAAGLPIIYTPVGACAEILGPEHGIRLERSVSLGESLGQSIWELYTHPERRREMSIANRKLACEKFDVSVVGPKLINIYKEILR